jgi:hypothetical protein
VGADYSSVLVRAMDKILGTHTVQQARNLSLALGEKLERFRFLIRDRGSNFTQSFDAIFQANGPGSGVPPSRLPRMNATCERSSVPFAASF